MAINTDSRGYKSLIKNGYTDEQITQMQNQVLDGQSAKDVVANTPAANPSQIKPKNTSNLVDPIAFRPEYNNGKYDKYIEGWDPNKLNNADINISQYGDDSSAKNYNNSALWGGENQKYTGENTLGSQIAYNPNATIAGLDPNYLYGQAAQMQNSQDANYIARRNDEIASALYNEGKVTIQDVAEFLSKQNQWDYSNENERQNTIMSVWKRIGQIAEQNRQKEEEKQQELPQGEEFGAKQTDEGGLIFGRASGNDDTTIRTNADQYSTEAINLKARQSRYESLQNMDSYDIALNIAAGVSLYGETAMRDLATFDPQKYQEVQSELKKIQQGETMNAIASGETNTATSQTQKSTDAVNSSIDTWVNQNSTERNSSQVQSILTDKLANSQTAQTATQEMLNLNAQMAELEEKIANLPKEAQKAFKGDVPQYIIDAFVANNAQRYQSELNKLQSRYNSAIELYKTDLAQKQREAEMELKQAQFDSDQRYRNREMSYNDKKLKLAEQDQNWNQNYMNTKLRYDNIKEINGEAYIMDASTGKWTKLSDDMAYQSYKADVQDKLNTYLKMFPDGSHGDQCEVFTDSFTYSTTGLKMEGANGRSCTTVDEKIGYVNTWIPELGSVAVFDYGIVQNDGVNYGHTMLVTGYDPSTGIITLTGSNKSKKSGEYEKVYTQTMTLAQLNAKGSFKGFWNPYLDKVEQSYGDGNQWNQYYLKANTPMSSTIDKLKSNASTASQLTQIAVGEQMYNTMYELQTMGYLDKLVSSGVMEDFLNAADRENFGKQGDDRGAAFLSFLGKYVRNKVKDEEVSYAMNRLYQLVEQKLRKESGAAINSSEWQMDFQLFLPQPGMSDTLRRKQLEAWDDIIYRQLSEAGMMSVQYIPIFNYDYGSGSMSSGRTTR